MLPDELVVLTEHQPLDRLDQESMELLFIEQVLLDQHIECTFDPYRPGEEIRGWYPIRLLVKARDLAAAQELLTAIQASSAEVPDPDSSSEEDEPPYDESDAVPVVPEETRGFREASGPPQMPKAIQPGCLMVTLGAAIALTLALSGCAPAPPVVQRPAPVEQVAPATPEPTASVQPKRVPVPLVTGKSVEMAEWKLQGAGFATKVKWKASSTRRGKVLSQSPSKGTALTGTTVVLTVSSGGSGSGDDSSGEVEAPSAQSGLSSSDQAAQIAFQQRRSGVALSGQGTVDRVLADDNAGDRHQRFILRLQSGQTLLVAHNIDIAPRLPSLASGDTVAFKGIYEWNSQGGLVHWTHDDPDGGHPGGWLEFNGKTYR